jgi:hypothetical protein
MPKGPRPAMASVDEPLEPDANGDGLCADTILGKNYSVMHRKSCGGRGLGFAGPTPNLSILRAGHIRCV